MLMALAVPPDIDDSRTSRDYTVTEGDNVTLTCEATGHPKPQILWRREDGHHISFPDEHQNGKNIVNSFEVFKRFLA